MLNNIVARIVGASVRFPWRVIAVSALLVILCAVYVSGHFAINTDVNRLIDNNAASAQRDAAIETAFPGRSDSTLVVVRAPAPEFATQAAAELAARLRTHTAMFKAVDFAEGSEFFVRNGLLFLEPDKVSDLCNRLIDARPLLNALAKDPSLRGLSNLLAVTLLVPLQAGQLHLSDMATLLGHSADAVDHALSGKPGALSWRAIADPADAAAGQGQSLISLTPVLDFTGLQPGATSANAVRAAADALQLASRYGASVALTGPIPLADEEFASVQEGALLSGAITWLCVLVILWFALRSYRLVLAVVLVLAGGLVVTAALGLLIVGALNIISVAFAVLFVGIGVDFGIQFGVRFREQHGSEQDVQPALVGAARSIALPLTLAAVATAVGFFAFLPTDYRGVSELGAIAGVGILFVAFPSCLTLLPALIAVVRPPYDPVVPGFGRLAPVERVFQSHRKALLVATLGLIICGLPLLLHLRFDFNPLHLKNLRSESMATLISLAESPDVGVDNVQVLNPSLADAQALGARIAHLPEVARVITLASFVPDRQPEKLQRIAKAADSLLPVLQQAPAAAASDAERVAALRRATRSLRNAALDHEGPGAAEARHLSASLNALAQADAAARDRAESALALPLRLTLTLLEKALQPRAISLNDLPPQLSRNWLAPNGRALLDIVPRKAADASPDDDTQLRKFTQAVLTLAPDATGGPISILHSASVIVHAFIEAAVLAMVAITLLLWLALRRFDHVLFTVVPLLVSALVTLELCVVFGIAINFANIIALPLLLGIGVAFKIYYVLAWREGQAHLLASGLTQAIILSAATTGTAFGSLWLSHHPGTASMGKLLVLSLVCTLIGAVFFQPILMGKPREPAPSRQ